MKSIATQIALNPSVESEATQEERERKVWQWLIVSVAALVAVCTSVLELSPSQVPVGVNSENSAADASFEKVENMEKVSARVQKVGQNSSLNLATELPKREHSEFAASETAKIQNTQQKPAKASIGAKPAPKKVYETVVSVGAAPEFMVQDLRRQLEFLENLEGQKQNRIEALKSSCAENCTSLIAAIENEKMELNQELDRIREQLQDVTTEAKSATHEIVFTYGSN